MHCMTSDLCMLTLHQLVSSSLKCCFQLALGARLFVYYYAFFKCKCFFQILITSVWPILRKGKDVHYSRISFLTHTFSVAIQNKSLVWILMYHKMRVLTFVLVWFLPNSHVVTSVFHSVSYFRNYWECTSSEILATSIFSISSSALVTDACCCCLVIVLVTCWGSPLGAILTSHLHSLSFHSEY